MTPIDTSTTYLARRPSSTIGREDRDGRAVYVKRYVEGDWFQSAEIIRARTLRETGLLARLDAIPRTDGRLGVLKLVEADPDSASLVTEEAPGGPLQDLLLAARGRRAAMSAIRGVYLAGKWLAAFQTVPWSEEDARPLENDPLDMIENCDLRLKSLVELGSPWPTAAQREATLAALRRLFDQADEQDRRWTWCHADYGAFNILWDGETLTPIDFGMCRPGEPLIDVAYFVHRLEMLHWQFPWRRRPVDLWRRSFLRGYGRPDAATAKMYRFMMIRHLLCRLVTIRRAAAACWRRRLHNAWLRRCVKIRLMQLVNPS